MHYINRSSAWDEDGSAIALPDINGAIANRTAIVYFNMLHRHVGTRTYFHASVQGFRVLDIPAPPEVAVLPETDDPYSPKRARYRTD